MLTTSPTPGHAMRATDPGAHLGQSSARLESLQSGHGLVPVLVALQ